MNNKETPNFAGRQKYLYDPPVGIGAWNIWNVNSGARGTLVQIVDVEKGWNLNHEDLPEDIPLVYGMIEPNNDHGTAVLGILVGLDNSHGVTGICPDARIKISSHYVETKDLTKLPEAIRKASDAVGKGDIILIEATTSNDLPVEVDPDCRSAIEYAIINDRIVIEAAGNAGINIDEHMAPNDIGTIIVTGTDPINMTHIGLNYGNRVHFNGWGRDITTIGYGSLYSGDPNSVNDDYTSSFNGTSGAAPMVAGAFALLQSIYKAEKPGEYLKGYILKEILYDTGTPDGDPDKNLGKRPNLVEAVKELANRFNLNFDNFVAITGNQFDKNGVPFDSIGHYKLDIFVNHKVPHSFYFSENSNQVLRCLQDFEETNEKFNIWIGYLDNKYHKNFYINNETKSIAGKFESTGEVILKNYLIDAPGYNTDDDIISLKDPWLIDYNDPL